jgi:hypothetical protein
MNLSPDGRQLAFVGGGRLFVRDLESGRDRYIEGSEGAGTPFWSPDGRWIAFNAANILKKAPASGSGLPQTLCAVTTNIAGAWSGAGDIVIGEMGNGLLRVRDTGGEVVRLTVPDSMLHESRHLLPQFLPDGRQFLYVAGKSDGGILFAGSLGSEKRVAIMPVQSQVFYANGHLLYMERRQIMARTFDPVTLRLGADAYVVAGPVASVAAAGAAVQIAAFSAADKMLAFSSGGQGPGSITLVRNWTR